MRKQPWRLLRQLYPNSGARQECIIQQLRETGPGKHEVLLRYCSIYFDGRALWVGTSVTLPAGEELNKEHPLWKCYNGRACVHLSQYSHRGTMHTLANNNLTSLFVNHRLECQAIILWWEMHRKAADFKRAWTSRAFKIVCRKLFRPYILLGHSEAAHLCPTNCVPK